MRNWSASVTYEAIELHSPPTLEALRRVVGENSRVKAVGSRHSFNESADTPGVQVSAVGLPSVLAIDPESRSVTVSGGLTHAAVSSALHLHGLALPNLASLPHISMAGAIQTGTHGSGVHNPALSAAVTGLELVDAGGEVRRLTRGDEDFDAVVVGLGAFGVVSSVTQRVVEAFDVEQRVFHEVRWADLLPVFEDVMASAFSVSLFTRFEDERVDQIWVKRRTSDGVGFDLRDIGGVEARASVHPAPGTPADNVTRQLGIPGPSHERLPHFRADFQPSRGDEIQSEYMVDARVGVDAINAVRGLQDLVAPLLHAAEIRRIAPDSAWLSPSGGRDTMALHFTWRRMPAEVKRVLPAVEAALMPLGARPHWGKAFACGHAALSAAYPRLADFAALVDAYDPAGKFDNVFLRRVLGRV